MDESDWIKTEGLTPAQAMMRMFMGFIPARAIYVAAKLNIPDLLAKNDSSADDLAQELNVNTKALYRILRILAAIGVLRETEDGTFKLTEIGQTLRSDVDQSVLGYIFAYHEFSYQSFDKIMHSVETGTPSFAKVFGKPLFESIHSDPNMAKIFHGALANRTRLEVPSILHAYDFSSFEHVVDVGGGNGTLLSGILGKFSNLKGTLFELPPAIDAAKAGKGGPLPRCEFVSGDFFEGVPAVGDVYILKLVLHDFDDEECVRIMQSCGASMGDNARLLVIEGLIGEANKFTNMNLLDLSMMAINNGVERTKEDYASLFAAANFEFRRVLPTTSDLVIMEAFPAW